MYRILCDNMRPIIIKIVGALKEILNKKGTCVIY